jgi:hypothetical protein
VNRAVAPDHQRDNFRRGPGRMKASKREKMKVAKILDGKEANT